MRSERIHVRFSPWLLQAIDEAARTNLNSRSGFIRESVIMRLKDQRLTARPKLEDILEPFRQADKNNGG